MASQEMLEAAAAMRAAPALDLDIDDIETLRVSEGDEIEALAAVPEDVSRSDFDAGGVPARHVATPGVRDDRGVLYFHGGGYVAGSLDSHTELMSRIARACRAPVLSGIDYRLAPDGIPTRRAPSTMTVPESRKTVRRRHRRGLPPHPDSVGDSTGGAALTMDCLPRAEDVPASPCGVSVQCTSSPWTDLSGSVASMFRATVDPMLSERDARTHGRRILRAPWT